MCAGALLWARIQQLVFGARDEKAGAVFSKASLLSEGRFNHTVQVVEGILAQPSREILQEFFADRRSAL
jgi:tRNA(adenine34) deaminase